MRPLTDTRPKPLLEVGGRALIEWHLLRLAQAGFKNIVINVAYLGEQIQDQLKAGEDFGLRIRYSPEPPGALETAGGIATARPWQSLEEPFLVVNGDIFTDWPFENATDIAENLRSQWRKPGHTATLAHLVMVPNPDHHLKGDFGLNTQGRLCLDASATAPRLTYSGIGIFMPQLFVQTPAGQRAPLAPLLRDAISQDQIEGHAYTGVWTDVGTPQRLQTLDQHIRNLAHD